MFQSAEIKNLERVLSREPLFSGGYRKVSYDPSAFDFRRAAAAYLLNKGFTTEPYPLETLHLRVPYVDQLATSNHLNRATTEMENTHPALFDVYHRFVKYVAREVLQFDVVFERNPMLRFAFPVPLPGRFRARSGNQLTHHSDTLFGDFFEQINCWLPLTMCYQSNSLQMLNFPESIRTLDRFSATLDYDFAAYRDSRRQFFDWLDADQGLQERLLQNCTGIPCQVGDLILFDSRLIHGTGENVETATRISIDFRVVPLEAYNAMLKALEADDAPLYVVEGEATVRGDLYHEKSAFEL